MLNDALLSGLDRRPPGGDRRRSARAVVRAELVVRWHHDPDLPVRYPVLDVSEGGVRILSAARLAQGMSGTAVSLLPEGRPIIRPCAVSWARAAGGDGGPFVVGLRFA